MEAISVVPDPAESDSPNYSLANAGDANYGTITEKVQVDVWENWRTSPTTGAVGESYTLARDVVRRLHQAPLAAAPTTVYTCLVRGRIRMVEEDTNIVHNAITVDIKRQA